MNLKSSEDWQILCKTTPATINGVRYNGATSCLNASNLFNSTIFWLKLNTREDGVGSMGFGSYKILIANESYVPIQVAWFENMQRFSPNNVPACSSHTAFCLKFRFRIGVSPDLPDSHVESYMRWIGRCSTLRPTIPRRNNNIFKTQLHQVEINCPIKLVLTPLQLPTWIISRIFHRTSNPATRNEVALENAMGNHFFF